jgi:hypothetical protein|eukprot:COSAG01_NODE_2891_length_6906_cov_10.367563_2_plen_77_part_00
MHEAFLRAAGAPRAQFALHCSAAHAERDHACIDRGAGARCGQRRHSEVCGVGRAAAAGSAAAAAAAAGVRGEMAAG